MTKEVEKDETREDEKYSGTENTRKIEETQWSKKRNSLREEGGLWQMDRLLFASNYSCGFKTRRISGVWTHGERRKKNKKWIKWKRKV
jgi:hypothetical protein